MNNGIKPTRLWHLTGSKHFLSMLKRRLESCRERGRVIDVRDRKDHLMLYALTMANVIAVAYSFGLLSPPKDCSKAITMKAAEESDKLCPPNPCPPIKKPKSMPKCPTCGRAD